MSEAPIKQCACGEDLFKTPRMEDECYCCCRQFDKKTKDFYWCSKGETTCKFKKINGSEYRVCSQCYEQLSNFDHLSGDAFTFNKIKDTMKIIKNNIGPMQNVQQLKQYMFGVNWHFNKGWIAKLKETAFGHTDYFKDVSSHYYTFYHEQMNKIRDLVDSKELNLNGSTAKHDDVNNMKKEQMGKMNDIALKWKKLNDEQSSAKERLLFVNNIFKEFFDTTLKSDFFEIFEHSLADYSAVDLLNDFQHFQSFHFEEVFKCDCEIEQFIKMEREKQKKSKLDTLSTEYRNILDIVIKAHQFIMHRMHIRPMQWQKRRDHDDKKYEKNKFVQEMIESEEMENETDEKEQRMNHLMDELIKKGMKQESAKTFKQYLEVHQYDDDAIRFDLEQRGMFNRLDESFLYKALDKNKYFVKVIKNHLKIKGNDNDKLTVFSFGEESPLVSWQFYKGKTPYFIIPKYANLKEELLNNSICAMDIELFDRQLLKAHIFASSKKGKRIKAKDADLNNKYVDIPPFCPISVAHILCILIYCNCTNQQYEFKKYGTRKHKNGQTLKELKGLNAEINHWYSLLNECVYFYGSDTTENDIFYTGLSIPLVFDSFAPKFRAPISTTVDLNIATTFSKGIGVILKLRQGSGRPAYYFDVEWLSNFEYERERLFSYVEIGRMCIEDVQTWHDGKKFVNYEYIKAMRLFSSLFAGYYLLKLCNKKNQRLLCALIQNFNLNNNIKSNGKIIKIQITLFLEQIFFNLVLKMNQIVVIKQEYEKLSAVLKNELFLINDNDLLPSPFVKYLMETNGKKIEFLEEFIWILDVEQINALKYGQKNVWVYSYSFYYYLSNGEKVEFRVGIRTDSSDKYTEFKLHIIKTANPLNGIYSVCVDDIGYVDNARSIDDLSSGRHKNIFCFEEKCLEKISDSLTLRVAVKFT